MNKHTKPTAASSVTRPLPPVGLRGVSEASEAKASELSKPCRECDGEGTGQYMAIDETDYHVRRCHVCDGSGREAPYCETCEGKLTVDGFCYACDDWGSLVYVERISPTRIAL